MRTLVSAGGGLGGWNGRRGSDELVLVSSEIPLLAYSLSSFFPVERPSTTSRMGEFHPQSACGLAHGMANDIRGIEMEHTNSRGGHV